MDEQVVNKKSVRTNRKIVRNFQDVVCKGTVWVLDELSLGEDDGELRDGSWFYKKKGSTDDTLKRRVQSLEDERSDENFIEFSFLRFRGWFHECILA